MDKKAKYKKKHYQASPRVRTRHSLLSSILTLYSCFEKASRKLSEAQELEQLKQRCQDLKPDDSLKRFDELPISQLTLKGTFLSIFLCVSNAHAP